MAKWRELAVWAKFGIEAIIFVLESIIFVKWWMLCLGGNVASGELHKVTAYKQDKRDELQDGHEVNLKPCRYCGRTGHGENPSLSVREKKCPAWNKECNHCHAKGHFKSRCRKEGVKVDLVKVQERKDMVCSGND